LVRTTEGLGDAIDLARRAINESNCQRVDIDDLATNTRMMSDEEIRASIARTGHNSD